MFKIDIYKRQVSWAQRIEFNENQIYETGIYWLKSYYFLPESFELLRFTEMSRETVKEAQHDEFTKFTQNRYEKTMTIHLTWLEYMPMKHNTTREIHTLR